MFVFAILSGMCHAVVNSPARKGLALGSPVCDDFLCICPFPIRYPRPGVALDCVFS